MEAMFRLNREEPTIKSSGVNDLKIIVSALSSLSIYEQHYGIGTHLERQLRAICDES
jgi:hypothetical protein